MEEKLLIIKEKKTEKKYRYFFKKKNKIKKYNFKKKKIIKKKNFILIKNIPNKSKYPKIGIIINKKNIKKSIQRNKLKRIIRETFRLKQHKIKKINYLIKIINKKILFLKKKKLFKFFIKIWKTQYIN